ncbi:glutathione S-transferase [Caulobacter sp. SLTY]|uniref:glutathione S-transferase family protein n=1 Tax=Caulobacter sp. SLTY TaxID=2683262 RepID=UPI0014127B3B|nr:glutathione S-transferase [Caulobacter sp. SLTY]NBB15410.1 glutathione S-transferase [Caulobacter sp. SLTY]
MSYTLFYAPGTASLAVHWMLIELGVPFEAEAVDIKAERSAAYLALNPSGRVPTLVVDGRPVSESAALLMLLAERHPQGGFAPAVGAPERAAWMEAMVFVANTLSPAMRDWFYAEKDGDPAGAAAVQALARLRIEGAFERLDGMLADGRPYLLGEMVTTVDLLATMLMRWSRNMERPATSWSRLGPYVTRMRARPGFVAVCRREGLTEWLNA